MSDSAHYLDSLPVRCRVYGLSLKQSDNHEHEETEQIVLSDRPVSVQLTVEFLGNSAIALLMLEPTLSIELLAKSVSTGETWELGKLSQTMTPKERMYAPVLDLEPPTQCGLDVGMYRLTAIVRIGAPDGPALLSGLIEDNRFEVFSNPTQSSKRKRSSAKSS
ncbi:MAG: hypothetical protein AAFR31_15975 [Cyanobacteria bacterium J06627_8]